jgi:hypothetical protein
MAAYFPLTLFYFMILFFRVKIMSGHMLMAISVCQAISFPAVIRSVNNICFANHDIKGLLKIFFSLHGIWNLDFFRPFYSNLCLGIGVLPTLALDYAIAVYPLLLMIVSYLLIILYDRNYRVVTAVWSPFRKLFSLFRRDWDIDIKTSLIDSFATFFFLSNLKFLSVSFDLLVPTRIYHFESDGVNFTDSLVLHYAPDIQYFGKQHIPFGIIAIIVVCLLCVLPVALLGLYPFGFFQRFLNLFPLRWYVLHTFMDSLLGSYKDGTKPGTRDCRYFLALHLLSRYFLLAMRGVNEKIVLAYAMVVLGFIIFSAIIIVMQPYKTPPSNLANTLYNSLLTFLEAGLVASNVSMMVAPSWSNVVNSMLLIACCIPLLDAARVSFVFVFKRKRGILVRCWRDCWRGRLGGYEELPGDGDGREREEKEVADRLENPEDYPAGNLPSFATLEAGNCEETY